MIMGTAGEVIITTAEYKELIEKALRYDIFKNYLSERGFLTDVEKLLLGIEEEDN